jgi:hypothetical protein
MKPPPAPPEEGRQTRAMLGVITNKLIYNEINVQVSM